ncbi:demethoxyubiquinone hydroxylase family protein, partial [Pseudomonas sp. FW305-130]
SDPELSAAIRDFQAEEVEHRETALAAGAENAVGYPLLSAVIRLGCKVAIATAKRI